MDNLLVSLFTLGCVDFLSPTSLTIIFVLSTIVKKKEHVLIYIIAHYFAYVLAAFAVFFGADRYLEKVYIFFLNEYPDLLLVGRIAIGIFAIIVGAFMISFLIYKTKKHEKLNVKKMVKIQSSAPIFLVLFAFAYVWGGLYGYYSLFAFVAVLISNNISFPEVIPWLLGFCSFTMITKLFAYIVITLIKSEKVEKVLDVATNVMTYLFFIIIPLLLFFVAYIALKSLF